MTVSQPSDPRSERFLPLKPANAVAAIIVVEGSYLLQLRDPKAEIFFPAQWGCFGGGVEDREEPPEALCRELHEELGVKLSPERLRYFTRFDFDLGFAGLPAIWRQFYDLTMTMEEVGRLALGEGAAMRVFSAEAIVTHAIPLTPYDAFALWFHINQERLRR